MLTFVRLFRAVLVLLAVMVASFMLLLVAFGLHPHNVRYIRAWAAHHESPSEATAKVLAAETRAHYRAFVSRALVSAALLAVLVTAIFACSRAIRTQEHLTRRCS